MKKIGYFLAALSCVSTAQNAAVSSYLNPSTFGISDIRIREIRVPVDGHTIDTYWCTLGYRTTGGTRGYGGIQWTGDFSVGPKNYIYSQWNDYSTSAYNDPATQVMTFGGEGTGVKSMNNDPNNQWNPGFWHVNADRAWNEGENTHFAFITRNGETGVWHHMMTWNTPEEDLRFRYSYTFLEDWFGWTGEYREAHMRKGWERTTEDNAWNPITSYTYSVNTLDLATGGRSYNKRTNWRGGKQEMKPVNTSLWGLVAM